MDFYGFYGAFYLFLDVFIFLHLLQLACTSATIISLSQADYIQTTQSVLF